jgi:hypothetical protein
MPISLSWYDDQQRVFRLKFEGSWDWEELRVVQEEENRLAAAASYNLMAFVDMSQTKLFPKGNILVQGRGSVSRLPDNLTLIVVVIQSRMIEVFAGLVMEMMPSWKNRVQFAKTVEEGQKLVADALAKNAAQSSDS